MRDQKHREADGAYGSNHARRADRRSENVRLVLPPRYQRLDTTCVTGGRGTFSSRFLAYEQCPTHIAQKVIAAHEEQGEAVAAH